MFSYVIISLTGIVHFQGKIPSRCAFENIGGIATLLMQWVRHRLQLRAYHRCFIIVCEI